MEKKEFMSNEERIKHADKTAQQKAEHNGVNTSDWGYFTEKEKEILSKIVRKYDVQINPNACASLYRWMYEDHTHTQSLIRRYENGRPDDKHSSNKVFVSNIDRNIKRAIIKKGFSCTIEKTRTCLGACININIERGDIK